MRKQGRRVGIILPSTNTTLEPDYAWVSPADISFHVTRVPLFSTTPEGLREMNNGIKDAAGLLSHFAPDLVAFACTSGSFIDGLQGLKSQIDMITGICNCPVVATSQAIIDAFRHLNIRNIALATPYVDSVNELEQQFFESNELRITSMRGLGLSGAAIGYVTPDEVVQLARAVDSPDAEAIFLSCTDMRAIEVLDALEQELGKPVLSSNQVSLWSILRSLDKPLNYQGFGSLLSR